MCEMRMLGTSSRSHYGSMLPGTLGAVLVSAVLSLVPVRAEEPLETFGDHLDLSLVELDVRVTGDDGKSVTDLPQDAFRVFFDEQPVSVRHFAAPGAPLPAAAVGEQAPLAIIVLVDNRHLLPARRNRMLDRLDDALTSRMSTGAAVMITVYDDALRCLTPFTTERAVLDAALARIRAMPSMAPVQAREALRLRQALRRNAGGHLALEAEVDAHVARRHAEIQRSIATLHEQILAVAGFPGRKVLLFLSDGLESNAGEAFYRALPPAIRLRLREVEKEVRLEQTSPVAQYLVTAPVWPGTGLSPQPLSLAPAIAAANANRVALYPLVPEHLDAATSDGSILARRIDQLQRYETLASATGGTVLPDLTPSFGNVLDDALAPAYSLAFQTSTPTDGSRHTIRVEVTDPTLRVHHRQAFFAKSAASRLAEGTLSTLFLDHRPNPLGLQAAVEEVEGIKGRQRQIVLQLRLPADGLALEQGPGGRHGRLHLCLVLRDARGARSEVEHLQWPVRIPALTAAPALFTFHTKIHLRRGAHTLALGLLDEVGQTASFLRLEIPAGS